MSKKVPLIRVTRPTRPRNAFDLSQRHLFTATCGLLQPVLALELMPHDHVEIQASDFMRCMPMNSAAFCSMRGVYEFFAVPISQLYHPFDQFITGMKDFRSSVYSADSKLYDILPCCTIGDILDSFGELSMTSDIFGFPIANTRARYLDLLGYGSYFTSSGGAREVSTMIKSMKVNPLRICAFNKIYADFYRHTTYEPYSASSFNLDKYFNDPSKFKGSDFVELLTPYYRNAEVDMFTNVRPSPLFDDSSVNYFNGVYRGLLTDGTSFDQTDVHGITIDSSGSGSGLLSTNDIRGAFALDKLLQVTQRAGKTYAEQIKAHFGYEVSEGRDGRCHYLGGFDSDIQVGDVTQQSGTSSVDANVIKHAGYLGRVTGKGTASGSGSVKYDANEHCILMCVYSVVPNVQYDSTRVDWFVRKNTRGDYFIPEFEDLGMQPLDTAAFSMKDVSAIGWQPRYSEYKTALDINHGQFGEGEPLSYWTIGRSRSSASLASWNISSLKINPRWVNDVFAVNYNGTQVTDFLFGGCNFRIQKVSDMSEQGVPRV